MTGSVDDDNDESDEGDITDQENDADSDSS